jgi:2,4-dienoyl-CoA reductase-like NADH-dependent reductase (Old Yellow Enzyme family)
MSSLSHILSPITIKSMERSNRVVRPPMGTSPGDDHITAGPAKGDRAARGL